MYIEEIIIDGFKSYATRTVVSGFDPNFNAITGLNGSGKSNILDSICFVLGISNLSQVRVNNLQELVYKQGQAGVTKASVSIVFNNDDKKASPVGYEQYNKITVTRQVVIGGRNKYLINGHNAQLNRVQNLFHSVQLNVNNPHFLIMQGRITKVLNMKPPEILAMIEEAAGTRMFEMKKVSALKTIEKKQKKVDEIQRVLQEEITPTLENLRKERSHYIQWSNNQTQLERLSRFCIAYDFFKSEETLKRSADELTDMQNQAKALEDKKEGWADLIAQNKTKINKLTEQKEREMDSDLKKLDAKVEELSKEYVKQTSAYKHKKDQLDHEKSHKANLKKNSGEVKANLEQKRAEKSKIDAVFAVTEEENKKLSTLLKDLQRQLQAVSAGISSETGDSGSLEGQLLEAKKEASQASTEMKSAQIRIQHLNTELASKKKDVQTSGTESAKLQAEHEAALTALAKIQKSLDGLKFNEQEERALTEKKREEERAVAELREKVDHLASGLSRMQFVYNDPEKNFDRRKVKGLVANLITLTDNNTAVALERTAGGKLRNVVVDNELTGKALLSKGGLRERVTIIPLNKINNRTVEPAKVKAAQSIAGPENVTLALDLVKYDKEVQNAMNYVFGNTLICKEPSHAKQVTFDQRVRTKSVTMEGDVYDPQGTLSGGSQNSGPNDLVRLAQLNATRAALQQREASLADVVARLAALQDAAAKYRQLKQQLVLHQHEVELVKARLAQSPHHQLIERVHAIETQLKTEAESIEELKKKEKAANDRHKELEQNSKGFASRRDSKLKGIETQIGETKVTLAKSTTKLKAQQQDQEALGLEINDLETELKGLDQQSTGYDGSIEKLEKDVQELSEKTAKTKKDYDDLKGDLDKKREKIQSQSKAIQDLIHDNDKHQKKIGDVDLELKTLEHKISRFEGSRKDASRFVQKMLSQHAWIANDKQFFGVPKSDYDFSATDPAQANKRLIQLQEDQERLTKSLNKKVMSMFEKAEQEYKELMTKKTIIENDKSKIEAVIAELDEKKNEALSTTWQKVNKDFGSIFGTLLPGTKAKLEPPTGQTVLDGLEVKVAFGEVWKDSLAELSGGQRSLLALSLILALLLFKPAPMYILDEIDAALDLSHTQNIGQMLKAHFTHSQFIIVSLKEGMFSNANVLFQTKFVDGVSTVTRTIPNKDNNKENVRPKQHK